MKIQDGQEGVLAQRGNHILNRRALQARPQASDDNLACQWVAFKHGPATCTAVESLCNPFHGIETG